jgi:hypothetical protein
MSDDVKGFQGDSPGRPGVRSWVLGHPERSPIAGMAMNRAGAKTAPHHASPAFVVGYATIHTAGGADASAKNAPASTPPTIKNERQ